MVERAGRLAFVRPDVIGVAVPLTGNYQPWGEAILKAVQLALGEPPAARLAVRDTRGDPEAAAKALEALALEDGAIAVVGGVTNAEAERAAARGCQVTGISLSREQLDHARERVRGTPAERLTEFRFLDYRDLEGRFDALVSIEMLEAVGKEFWSGYFTTLRRSLKPGGKAALQTITIADERFDSYQRGTDFIQQYIFPGGMLPSPSVLKQHIRHANLDLLDIHSFGADYARTLRLWRENFEAALPAIRGQGFDEAFIRLWRFYLCYCEAGFLTGRTVVYQALMTY